MYYIIWYWSLLNPDSIARTCEFSEFEIWQIYWFKRIFNKVWYSPKDKKCLLEKKCSHLNLIPEKDFKITVSCFKVDEKWYEEIKNRELWYSEKIVDFYDLDWIFKRRALVFIAENKICGIRNILNLTSDFLPEDRYLKICFEGINNPEIKENFLTTTFLWDWKTTLKDYLK